MAGEALLLSIRPTFAERIFDGTKRVELRRLRPAVAEGGWIFVYVSSPVKALVGAFEVDGVISAPPEDLWHNVQREAAITHGQFDRYFAGASVGFGIFVRKTWKAPEPVTLCRLRGLLSNFRPPQGYRYLTSDEVTRVSTMGEWDLTFPRPAMQLRMTTGHDKGFTR